ncbi:hypothetical protein KIN20_023479 [Parelaphostrongylus tenuis]|uniref:Uncharacterized protein n=1 Tax=Parelaphostrongylus tenuis TaxID=148309 RepID=A0AAD5QVW0_PARTN|nr:hypothetical protein KIN20_023479 [Parelaphostrongylus tenuis]
MISMYSYPIKKNDTLLQRALVPSPSSFTLPVAMVYTGDSTISTQVFGTANNKGGDQALVNCLVMQVNAEFVLRRHEVSTRFRLIRSSIYMLDEVN